VHILSRISVTVDGVWIGNWTEFLPIRNYNTIAISHAQYFTTACSMLCICRVFTSRCLVTTSNTVDPSDSALMVSRPRWLSPVLLQFRAKLTGFAHLTPLALSRAPRKGSPATVLLLLDHFDISQTTERTLFLCCCLQPLRTKDLLFTELLLNNVFTCYNTSIIRKVL
jgi:hypothetical protein